MPQTIPLSWYLVLSAVLFALGAAGFVFRRNIITMFMSIELMLNAVNLTLASFARQHGHATGQVFVLFVLAVAAAEVAVGLAIIIALFRHRDTLDLDRGNLLKG